MRSAKLKELWTLERRRGAGSVKHTDPRIRRRSESKDEGTKRASLDTIERIANEMPCYQMHFDKSGAIVPLIEALAFS